MPASTSSLHEVLELLQATSQDLAACGPGVAHLLSRLAETCLRRIALTHDDDDARSALHLSETLRRLADDKLNSFPYHAVPTCWRRLYTDAVLYGAVAQLAQLANSHERGNATHVLLQTIGRLDSAIVISGSPGPMRLELAQSLISRAQHQIAAAAAPRPAEATSPRGAENSEEELEVEGRERPVKRPRMTRSTSPSRSFTSTSSATAAAPTTTEKRHPPPYIHIPLRELASLPTFLDPAHNPVHREPFIVRRGAVHFPAFDPDPDPDPRPRFSPQEYGDDDGDTAYEGKGKAADYGENGEKRAHTRSRWSDLAYLRRLAGPGRIVPVEVGGDYTQSGWGQQMMPFDEFLDSLGGGVVVAVGTGEEDAAGSSRRRRMRKEMPPSVKGDDDDEDTGSGGGGGNSTDSTTPILSTTSTTRAATGSNAPELDADCGERQLSPPSTTATTTTTNTTAAAAAAAAAAERVPDRPIYYLAQHSLFRQFPALVSDLLIPDLVYSPPEHHYPSPSLASNTGNETSSYDPPQSEEGYVLNAWFGPGGTKSAAHTDPWWNCYVQMAGSKWVWVAPPECGPYMAAFGNKAGANAESDGEEDQSAKPDSGAAEEYMTNTSSLDVTLPPPPLSPSDSDKPQPTPASPPYPPQFLQHVLPHARQAVLEEGDVLVMPPRWWHAMVGLETSFSVSMWF